jgi:hypothetical protein
VTVHVCAPEVTYHKAILTDCPDCGKPSIHLVFGFEWYGPDRTCLRCGRRWSDGEWMPLDFYRHARRDNIRSAIRRWRQIRGSK